MKIAFMGTPDFAVDCLTALINSKHEVVGVFCQPDKPVGRKQVLTMPPVKQAALEAELEVFQPTTLRNGEGEKILEQIQPDLIIVVAYGKLLPVDVLDFPKYGCINIHASILPKYRGASPIHWAVINGDKITGVTAMQMDDGLDTGDILHIGLEQILENDTTEIMYEKLAPLGAKVLLETLEKLEKNELVATKQDDGKATKVGLLNKETGKLDFNDLAFDIHNKIRGLYSWPCAHTKLNGKILKIQTSRLTDEKGNNKVGEMFISGEKLLICCGENSCIEVKELQLEGKKRMDAQGFINGYKSMLPCILG